MTHTKYRNRLIYLALGLALILSFTACKPKTSTPEEDNTSSSESSAAPDSSDGAVSTEPSETPDQTLTAYMNALESGDWDKAQSYIWPYAEAFEGTTGKTIQNLRDTYQTLGYGTLSGGEFTAIATYSEYTVYDVKYRFTPDPGSDVVNTEMLTVVTVGGQNFISPNNLLCAYEVDPAALVATQKSATSPAVDESDSEDDDIIVAPDEPLDGSESSEDMHQVPIADEEISEAEGVTAQVTRAASYASGVYFDIEINNASDGVMSMGGEDSEALAVVEGVVITDDPSKSVDLAKDHGFELGNDDEGALDSRFDTFAGQYEVPAKQKANTEIFFTQDLRLIYNLYFPEIRLGDNTRSLPISWAGLKLIDGGLSSCAYLVQAQTDGDANGSQS